MKLVLLRHGETGSNLQGEALASSGEAMARENIEILKNFNINYIYSSPSLRAIQSIQPFSQFSGIKIVQDQRIRDRFLSNIRVNDYISTTTLSFQIPYFSLPGGESIIDVSFRVKSFIDSINAIHGEDCILVSTHGICMSLILADYYPKESYHIWKRLKLGEISTLKLK